MKDLRSRWIALILFLSLIGMLGCATLQGDPLQTTSNTALSMTPGRLDFGMVVVGRSKTLNAVILNRSVFGVTVTQATTTGSEFQITGPALPVTIRPGRAVAFSIRFTPQSVGTPASTLAIASSAQQPSSTMLLSGQGVIAGQLAPSLPSIDFGNTTVGQQVSRSETFTNSGSTSVTVSQLGLSSTDFQVSGVTLPFTVDAGQSVTFNVIYAPKAAGASTGTLSVNADVAMTVSSRGRAVGRRDTQAQSFSIPLSGSAAGSVGALTATPAGVSFGNVQVNGSTSSAVVLKNTGTASVSISQAAVTGTGFSISGLATPVTLTGGQSATLNVTFAPKSAGAASGNIAITSSASNPSLNVALSGTGVTPGTLTTATSAMAFGTVQVGSNQKQTATVTNSGGSSVTINQLSVTGSGFSLSGMTTPVVVAAGQSASFTATFAPTAAGNASGTVSLTSTASATPLTWTLSGSGATAGALTASPSSLSFGTVQTGSTKTLQETLTNSGGTAVSISQIATAGGYSVSGLTLPATVNAGQSISFNVVFTPSASGAANSSLTVTSNASNASLSIPLSGAGATPGSLSAGTTSLSFGTVVVGDTQTSSETITNNGGMTVTVSQVAVTGTGFSLSGVAVPFTLAAGASKSFNVAFAPQSTGTPSGTLTVTSDASNPSLTVPVSGTAVAAGSLAAGTPSLVFGTVSVGSNQSLSETITNSGGSSVNVTQATVTGAGFSLSGLTVPFTLAAGASKSFSVSFAPQAAGTPSGTLTVTSNASNPSLTVPLSGTAVTAGSLTAGSPSLSFGTVTVGNTQTLSETITNSGGTTVNVSQVAVTGTGFSVTGVTVPFTLAAGASKSFSVSFAPQAAGTPSGTLTITSNASNPSLTVPVSGTAVTAGTLSASPASLSFGNVNVGSSKTLSQTVTNSGGTSVTVSQVAASGTGYSINGVTVPFTLAAGASKSFNVVFTPQSAGSPTGSVAITSNGSNPNLTISLTGTGTAQGVLSVNPTTMSFGNVNVGSNSSKTATITNTGNASLTVTQASASGTGFSLNGLSLPLTLIANQSFTFSVTFTPQSGTSSTGSVSFTSDASNSPTISLSGAGVTVGTFAVNPTSFSFGSVTVGSSKNMTATLSATGGSVTLSSASVNSAEFTLAGPALPLTIASGQTATFTVTFTPQSSGAASASASFVTNAVGSPLVTPLSGTGVAPIQHRVDLTWSPSTSTIVGYNVYRSATSGTGYARINSAVNVSTSYTDNSVQSGATYFYVTTAVDSSGGESSFSNEVRAAIPTP